MFLNKIKAATDDQFVAVYEDYTNKKYDDMVNKLQGLSGVEKAKFMDWMLAGADKTGAAQELISIFKTYFNKQSV